MEVVAGPGPEDAAAVEDGNKDLIRAPYIDTNQITVQSFVRDFDWCKSHESQTTGRELIEL